MAQYEQWFDQDFKEFIQIRHCESVMFTGDNAGAVVGVHLFDGGTPYSGGGSIIGYAKRIDGGKVPLTGSLSGNAASVVIPQAALAYPGPLGIHVVLTSGDQITTVLKAIYSVDDTTGIPVDPGQIVPDWEEFLAELEAMRAGTAAAVSAASAANTAANGANSAASNASDKASAANTAAGTANTAASSANAAASNANEKAGLITGMTTAASGLSAGASPTATITTENGHYKISFGIPNGDTGNSGVYYGTQTPTDPAISVWIDPTGEPGNVLRVKSGTSWVGLPTISGTDGVTYTPSVDANGNLSWTNDGGLPNPQTVNIKGPKGDDGDVSAVNGISPDANGNVTIPAATQSASGVMSAADKTKLDGLPSSAAVPDSIAIVANGDTHGAILSGQNVYVRGHGTLSEGLYTATANIAQNAALSTSNLTAVSNGGLNSVKPKFVDVIDVILSDLTWITSGRGMYYAEVNMPSEMTGTPISITIIDFSALRATDNISAILDKSNNKFVIMSNTTSFAQSEWTAISVRIAFIS